MSDQPEAVSGGETKVCPDCAETVQQAARMCRYCGYRFDTGASGGSPSVSPPPEPAPKKSAPGAAILSFVVPGLGHFYLGEGWRGGVLLASFIVLTVAAILTGTLGPGWIVGIIGAVDAFRGATSLNATGSRREVGTGLWVLLAASIILAVVAVVVDEQRARDAAEAERIESERRDREEQRLIGQQQLQEQQLIEEERLRLDEELAYEQCLLEREINPDSINICVPPGP